MIERKRLKLYAASKEQMEAFVAAQPIDEPKAAYTEMLNGALAQNKIGAEGPIYRKNKYILLFVDFFVIV